MARYEYVKDGCATNWDRCGRSDPVTVYQLDRNGRRRYEHLTLCVERSELSGEALGGMRRRSPRPRGSGRPAFCGALQC
jgi:hypothetical protein